MKSHLNTIYLDLIIFWWKWRVLFANRLNENLIIINALGQTFFYVFHWEQSVQYFNYNFNKPLVTATNIKLLRSCKVFLFHLIRLSSDVILFPEKYTIGNDISCLLSISDSLSAVCCELNPRWLCSCPAGCSAVALHLLTEFSAAQCLLLCDTLPWSFSFLSLSVHVSKSTPPFNYSASCDFNICFKIALNSSNTELIGNTGKCCVHIVSNTDI